MTSFLECSNLEAGYGDYQILHGCNLELERGEIGVVVGPNGAGKSTAMKAIFGLADVYSGSIKLNGKEISKLQPHERVLEGISLVPQTQNVFPNMTVEENLEMGSFLAPHSFEEAVAQVYTWFPILFDKRHQNAGELSGGQRQQVAIGRAIMTKPSLLMLDEPTAGISPNVVSELFASIREIAASGLAILMVEQNALKALRLADRAFLLVQGKNGFTGTGDQILRDNEIRKMFLGGN